MIIRESLNTDLTSIRALHLAEFGEEENQVVSKLAVALVNDLSSNLSLVAVEGDDVIGHVVFSPVTISNHEKLSSFILAPLVVASSVQNQGVGSKLIQFGFDTLANRGVGSVFVYGDPNYYSRSGFGTADNVKPPYVISYPAEAWQVKELKADALQGISGTIKCVSALMEPELW